MATELSDFEQSMQREIDAFFKHGRKGADKKGRSSAVNRAAKPRSGKQPSALQRTGHLIKLAVRTKRLEQDTVFEHRSSSISRLEAQLEAEKAARQAGYPIVGYVIEIQRL
jgi:hypothetical protein